MTGVKMKPEERMTEINSEIIKITLLSALSNITIGLSIYAKFVADGEAFLPVLNNESVVNSMLILGIPVWIWVGYKLVTLHSEKATLLKSLE
tara:strand:+ start:220 stop:495 length:276 start_codon:yes stop_codon:yes gene_type:complete